MGDNADEDTEITEVPEAVEMEETLTTGMINMIQEPATVKDNGTFNIIEGMDRKTHFRADNDNGMEMTLITVTETTGIEIPTVKVIPTGVEDGIIIIGVKDIVIGAEGEDGIPIRNITIPGYQQQSQFSNPNHYHPPPMGHQYRYPIPYEQYSYPQQQQQQQYQSQMPPAPSQQATNICQLCNSQGHYDYQCQFAGDFMARTQKAFNQGRSYSHQDPNHGEWSQGDNDTNDPNGQPFQ